MKIFVTFLMGCLLLTACKKEKDNILIEGHIYNSSNKLPMVGLHFSLYAYYTQINRYYDYLGEVTTDKNGYYKLSSTVVNKKFKNYMGITFNEPNTHNEPIEVKFKKKLNMVHYVSWISKHKVVLLVKDSLSKYDTLYLCERNGFSRPPLLALPGPFKNGQSIDITLGTKKKYSPTFRSNFYNSTLVQKIEFLWWVGWKEKQQLNNPPYYIENQLVSDVDRPVSA